MMGKAQHETRAVFTAALASNTPEERARYLDEACQGKPELRQRVESLLRAHEQASHFLEVNGPDQDALREGPGTLIGRYKLLEEIGEGAFGRVFMAEQTEPVCRKVALKIIKAGMDTREVIARFEAERQALALMDHPNIARVLDAGATETGRPYFVMELVRGIPITACCEQQQLSTVERLQLFIKVCAAVQHAHQKGIIHRDLKPTNILVTLIDGEAVPKVIDFGIAKALGQKLTEKTLFTAFQQMVGTPAYMSPEQAALSGVDVDTRSDIYSLGVLLYELLTGVTPFDQETLHKAALDEIRRLIRETEPPKPSTRLTELARNQKSEIRSQQWKEVRGDLDWIVMKCLEKDRARRYETTSALVADIQRHLGNEPIAARPPSKLYQLRKLVQRNKLAVAAGSVAAVSLVIGLTLATILFFRERTARRQADEQAAVAKAVNDFLQNDLLRQADTRAQANAQFQANPDLTVREALERASQRIGNRFRDQPLTELAIRLAIGDALRGVGRPAEAVPHLLRAVQLSQANLGPDHLETLKCMDDLGETYAEAGNLDRALPLLEKTLKLRKARLGPDHPDTLTTMNNLGSTCVLAGTLDEAVRLLDETVKLRKAVLGPGDPKTLDSMAELGEANAYAGNLDRAVPLFEETLERRKATVGPDHPDTVASMNNLAAAYEDTGRLEQALRLYQDTLTNRMRTFGPNHPETLSSKHNLGAAYLELGMLDQATLLLEEVLETSRAMLGPDHPHTLLTRHRLAEAYRQAGRLDQALSLSEEAVRLAGNKLGPDHFITIRLMGDLAGAYQDTSNFDQALPLFEQALKVRRATLGPEHRDTLLALANLGSCFLRQGNYTKAEPLLLSACEGLKQHESQLRSNDKRRLKETLQSLVRLYEATGRPEKAAEWKQKLDEFEKAVIEKQPAAPLR